MQDQTIDNVPGDSRGVEPQMANIWSWLVKKRWCLRTAKTICNISTDEKPHFSFWALALIFLVTKSWSYVVNEVISPSDAVRYYHFLQDGSWLQKYDLEQTMFWIMTAIHPTTFANYLLISASIPLCILLLAFYRLKYTRTDQFLLIFFFSCSFYGVHFVVTFQRQFYALALFIFAISSRGRAILSRFASLFSHMYAIVLHLFWELRRLPIRKLAMITIPVILIGFLAMQRIGGDKFEHYAAGGEASASALAFKEGLNLIYTLIVLRSLRSGDNAVRTVAIAFILFAIPALFWPAYAGIFVRFDYYFFPLTIALWPTGLDRRYRALFRITVLFSTITGFALWMSLNFRWVVTGIM